MTDEDRQWFGEQFGRVHARIEQVETSLLTEFRKPPSSADLRARTRAAVLRVLAAEMEFPLDRLKKPEGNQPQG